MTVLWLCYGYVVAAVSARKEAVLCPPCQPGKNKSACSPIAPHVFFQSLSSSLAYSESSKQCGPARQVISQTGSARQLA